jgi:hypothetical protein
VKFASVTILTLSALMLAPAAPAKEDADGGNFFEQALGAITLGPGKRVDELVIFPLLAEKDPAPLPVAGDAWTKGLGFAEPDFPRKRYDLAVENGGEKTVLLFGGGVVVGGRLDRLVPRDVLVPAGSGVEIHALPAEFPKDRRKEAAPFELNHASGRSVAPAFLRERAAFDPSRYLVPIFVSHYLAFRAPDDERRSLASIDESPLLAQYCDACHAKIAAFPGLDSKKVVGIVTAVRGRVLTLELFGTNGLFRAYFPSITRAHSYAAAAVALRAKDLGMPIPGGDVPEKTIEKARDQAEKLLAELREKSRFKEGDEIDGEVGEFLLIRSPKSDGTAIGLDGRLVHAVVYPENPFEEALYSRPFDLPEGGSGLETTFGELERREDRGTLSEYEKRLLDRMRSRRSR